MIWFFNFSKLILFRFVIRSVIWSVMQSGPENLHSHGVVPKSYWVEVRLRNTSDMFPRRVINGNCRLLQYHLQFTNSHAM